MSLLNPEWNRRKFMGAILGACAAPAIVRASSLMQIWTPSQQIALPESEIIVADAEWLDALAGCRMSGGSRRDIAEGACVPYKDGHGVTFMGYRFPGSRP